MIREIKYDGDLQADYHEIVRSLHYLVEVRDSLVKLEAEY
jgi:hypothetical protein